MTIMSAGNRTHLRHLMQMAWGLYRTEVTASFAGALAMAWRVRRQHPDWGGLPWADQPRSRSRHVRLRLCRPMRQRFAASAFASVRAVRAGNITSHLGS
jgi:hypothetical protein